MVEDHIPSCRHPLLAPNFNTNCTPRQEPRRRSSVTRCQKRTCAWFVKYILHPVQRESRIPIIPNGGSTTTNMERESHEMHSVSEETRQANAGAPKVPENTHEPMYTSRVSRASSMTVREPIVRTLHTSFWPLMVFIFYATLALFTWITFCVASSRPIGSKYDYTSNEDYSNDLVPVLAKHEKALRTAQILQSVVALLTIPITSAICSMALAAYIQAGSSRTKLNLRQTMALADQGWISPKIWARWSKVGSLPLYSAFALTLVGKSYVDLSREPVLTPV